MNSNFKKDLVCIFHCKFRDPGSIPGRVVLSFGIVPLKCKNFSDIYEGAKETSLQKTGWRS